jgi:hypothetical protein
MIENKPPRQKQPKKEVLEDRPISQDLSADAASGAIVAVSEILPPNLLLLPVAQTTLFPGMIVPVFFRNNL